MGGAGRDCGQLYSDGVLSRATEHLSRDSPPHENGDPKITTEDHIRRVSPDRAHLRKCIFATESS
jgi:hypothetical protein